MSTVPNGESLALDKVKAGVTVFGNDALRYVDVDVDTVDFSLMQMLDLGYALKNKTVPVGGDRFEVVIAVSDASNLAVLDDLRTRLSPCEVTFVTTDIAKIDSLLSKWSREVASMEQRATVADIRVSETPADESEAADEEGKIAKLVNNILEQAVLEGASDIHVEPGETSLCIRFRIDGVLQVHTTFPATLTSGIVNRVKVMANMEIAERRIPLDGRFNRVMGGKSIDCRVVSVPTNTGYEGAVLRILDQSKSRLSLADIGFHKEIEEKFLEILNIPHGMVLVVGPTGSGKTTTLYGALGQVVRPDRKILTIEDPVEINYPSVTQVQVNEKAGLTFTSALRSFLRADPDVILVGEVRDAQTAALAAQAALTGHLVLSTLHTNEAAGAPTRLSNMGLEGYIISSALKAVLSQRLLRKLCTKCAVPIAASQQVVEEMNFQAHGLTPPSRLYKASEKGCDQCDRRGYKGRVVAAEILVCDHEVNSGIVDKVSATELESIARRTNKHSIHYDALLWLMSGATSVEEVKRVGL